MHAGYSQHESVLNTQCGIKLFQYRSRIFQWLWRQKRGRIHSEIYFYWRKSSQIICFSLGSNHVSVQEGRICFKGEYVLTSIHIFFFFLFLRFILKHSKRINLLTSKTVYSGGPLSTLMLERKNISQQPRRPRNTLAVLGQSNLCQPWQILYIFNVKTDQNRWRHLLVLL